MSSMQIRFTTLGAIWHPALDLRDPFLQLEFSERMVPEKKSAWIASNKFYRDVPVLILACVIRVLNGLMPRGMDAADPLPCHRQ